MNRVTSHTQKTLDVPQKPAACLISVRTVYTDECLGPGNLKMVQLARKVGVCCWEGGPAERDAFTHVFVSRPAVWLGCEAARQWGGGGGSVSGWNQAGRTAGLTDPGSFWSSFSKTL